MLAHAFKEWAVICQALATGRQSLILRKGGIAENFQVEQRRFWLFPTWTHQQQDGIRADAASLLADVEQVRPAPDKIVLDHFAEVTEVYPVDDVTLALQVSHLHIWSHHTVEKRFAYRMPGLFVLAVRIHRVPKAFTIDNLPYYDGCKSWVDLAESLSTDGATPVLDDAAFRHIEAQLDTVLRPTLLA